MFLSIFVSKKTMFIRMITVFIGCCTMHANDTLSLLSQPNNSSWSSKLRHSLSSSFSAAWEKSYERFDALPTSYKYAVGGSAGLLLAGGAFVGYKKFAAQKQASTSNNANVIAVLGDSDPVGRYIEQFAAVGHQKKLPTEEGFVQFQNASDVGPTQVLQAACKHIYVGMEESAHHWSVLINSGANPFAPSIAENEVNAFVSLANRFEPQYILSVVQNGRGIYKGYSDQALFTPDEIKAGIKATLVQLLAKDGFEEEFNNIVDIVGNGCAKPEIAFTYANWEEVLVSAGTRIVNEEGYIRLLAIAAEMNAQASSCSSSSIEGDSQSSSADFVSKSAVASAPFYTIDIEVEGIKCCVRSHHNKDGSVWYYAVAFGSDSSNISIISPFHYYFNSEGFSGYIAQELRDKFGIDATEDGVKALLIRSNLPGVEFNRGSELLHKENSIYQNIPVICDASGNEWAKKRMLYYTTLRPSAL